MPEGHFRDILAGSVYHDLRAKTDQIVGIHGHKTVSKTLDELSSYRIVE